MNKMFRALPPENHANVPEPRAHLDVLANLVTRYARASRYRRQPRPVHVLNAHEGGIRVADRDYFEAFAGEYPFADTLGVRAIVPPAGYGSLLFDRSVVLLVLSLVLAVESLVFFVEALFFFFLLVFFLEAAGLAVPVWFCGTAVVVELTGLVTAVRSVVPSLPLRPLFPPLQPVPAAPVPPVGAAIGTRGHATGSSWSACVGVLIQHVFGGCRALLWPSLRSWLRRFPQPPAARLRHRGLQPTHHGRAGFAAFPRWAGMIVERPSHFADQAALGAVFLVILHSRKSHRIGFRYGRFISSSRDLASSACALSG